MSKRAAIVGRFVLAIRSQMQRQGVTVTELANRLGCTPANVSRNLRPGTNLTIESMMAIADAVGLSLELGIAAKPPTHAEG